MDRLEAGDPSQVGSFRLLGRLGEGGMGRVFLGASPGGRKVAIKVVRAQYSNDAEFRRRFAREVAAARQVGGFHTALVVDADPTADPPWMATSYIPGPSLADAVAQHGPLREAEVRELGAALAEGLAAIHACGLIHRDLKPSNIILADDGARIIDFGIARGADATALTGSHAVIGTLRYMSPEQLHGQDLTPPSDVFALGAVLAYAATGHDPFEAPTIPAVINHILNDPPNLGPLTGDVGEIIRACLAKEPGDRPNPREILARFMPPEAPHDPTVAATLERVPATIPASEPHPVAAREPERPAAREPMQDSTASAGIDIARRPVEPPGARTQDAIAPASELPRRKYRRRTVLIAAGTCAAIALATLTALHLDRHPANSPPATPGHPATSRPAAGTYPETGSLAATLIHPANVGFGSAAISSGGILAAINASSHIYLWSTATGKPIKTLTDPNSQGVLSVAFGPGDTLAAADANRNIYLWNVATGKSAVIVTLPAASSPAWLAFGPGDTLAALVGSGVFVWNTATGRQTAAFFADSEASPVSIAFEAHDTLATADQAGNVYLFNPGTGKRTASLTLPVNGVVSAAFGPDGILATTIGNRTVDLWNTATRTLVGALTGPAGSTVQSLAFGPSGTVLAAVNGNGDVYLWHITQRS
jgi:hypothetical protein